MLVRKAVVADAGAIASVHVDSWRTTYKDIFPQEFLNKLSCDERAERWERNIAEQHVFVAENNQGEIVGFSTGGKERTGRYENYTGELYAIYILEAYQGKGLGKLLVKPVVEVLKKLQISSMLVWVLEENNASNFYKAIGGKRVDAKEEKIAGKRFTEIAYGWDNINTIPT